MGGWHLRMTWGQEVCYASLHSEPVSTLSLPTVRSLWGNSGMARCQEMSTLPAKISEKLGQWGRQNMLRPYLKIWDWDWIFGHVVKTISSLGIHSPCQGGSELRCVKSKWSWNHQRLQLQVLMRLQKCFDHSVQWNLMSHFWDYWCVGGLHKGM